VGERGEERGEKRRICFALSPLSFLFLLPFAFFSPPLFNVQLCNLKQLFRLLYALGRKREKGSAGASEHFSFSSREREKKS